MVQLLLLVGQLLSWDFCSQIANDVTIGTENQLIVHNMCFCGKMYKWICTGMLLISFKLQHALKQCCLGRIFGEERVVGTPKIVATHFKHL